MNLEHVKHNFTCEKSRVPNSHVQFHTCEIMWNFCKGGQCLDMNNEHEY